MGLLRALEQAKGGAGVNGREQSSSSPFQKLLLKEECQENFLSWNMSAGYPKELSQEGEIIFMSGINVL